MTDLTTDERLSTMLVPVLASLQEASVSAHQNAEALRTNGKIAAASTFVVLEQRADEQVERLAEVMEALAAGTLAIVDEGAIVRVLRREFEVERKAPDTTRRAQLALEQLQFAEAIR